MPRPSGDLFVGTKPNNYTVITGKGVGGKNRSYVCQCLRCGHVYLSTLGALKSRKNDGCIRCSKRRLLKEGEIINGFQIVGFLRRPSKNRIYLVRCNLCGSDFEATISSIRKRVSNHCGCGESARATHGMSSSYEYKCWLNMKSRVLNPNTPAYEHYVVKKNLTLDERWLVFENFFKDMGKAPSHLHTVDRLDNKKGYSPDNCGWRTPEQQARNTSRNVWCEFEGKKYCLKDLCLKLGVRYNTIVCRKSRGHEDPFKLSGISGVKFLE